MVHEDGANEGGGHSLLCVRINEDMAGGKFAVDMRERKARGTRRSPDWKMTGRVNRAMR